MLSRSLAKTHASDEQDTDDAERRISRVRLQAAVVRAIADQVERVVRPQDGEGLAEQLVEETARLGRRMLEAAASMTPDEDTGVFARSA